MKKTEEGLSTPVWNQAELHDRVDNDEELLRELLAIYKHDFPGTIQTLRSTVARGDLKNTASLSHTLKGMLSNLGAARAAGAAARLEEMASGGEKDRLQDGLEALQREAGSLMLELDAYATGVRR